jgi:hypothetical protein
VFALKEEQLWGETQFEDPAHYAVPSAGVTWGSLSKEIQEDYVLSTDTLAYTNSLVPLKHS